MIKYILIFLSLTNTAFAHEKGWITVESASGEKISYNLDEYEIVKRDHHGKPEHKKKQQEDIVMIVVTQPAPERPKNRVRLMGGLGPNGVSVDGGPNTYTVSPSLGAVGGLGYSRLLYKNWSVDASILTNQTYMVGVGLDF